jgi:Na+/H+-dicarboxylate symporter
LEASLSSESFFDSLDFLDFFLVSTRVGLSALDSLTFVAAAAAGASGAAGVAGAAGAVSTGVLFKVA